LHCIMNIIYIVHVYLVQNEAYCIKVKQSMFGFRVSFCLSNKNIICFQALRQWCGIFHCHWWTPSIKPRLLFSHAGYASWGLSLSLVYLNVFKLLSCMDWEQHFSSL